MIPIPPEEIERIQPLVDAITGRLTSDVHAGQALAWLGEHLRGAEGVLLARAVPGAPAQSTEAEYPPEFGLALSAIHSYFPSLAASLQLPPTAMTPTLVSSMGISLHPHVGNDGTIYGFGTYEALDYHWALTVIYYVGYWSGVIARPPFAHNPQQYKISSSAAPVTVALVGDWGTGPWQDGTAPSCPSTQVMNAINALAPTITIHLGDVYYAGTMPTSQFPHAANEEENNFTAVWNPGSASINFTLNSNHEMYFAGQGYFSTALGAQAFVNQNGTSYFSIEGDNWVIIGLDSAYWSQSKMVMEGALTDYQMSDTSQLDFLQQYQNCGKTVIVLTHHNPVSLQGTSVAAQDSGIPGVSSSQLPVLLNQVQSALGGTLPNFWYWGHIHNAIAYNALSVAPGMTGRCVGHGALPFGCAYGLVQPGNPCSTGPAIPTVDWFARTPGNPDSEDGSIRVMNGFALLTFTADSFTETFYDQTGTALYSKSYSYVAAGTGGVTP